MKRRWNDEISGVISGYVAYIQSEELFMFGSRLELEAYRGPTLPGEQGKFCLQAAARL